MRCARATALRPVASATCYGLDATRQAAAGIATTAGLRMAHGMDAFLDPFRSLPEEKQKGEVVGREWAAKELSLKSFEDLHALWHVLLMEKNMLATENFVARANSKRMRAPQRVASVKRSMCRIKHVLSLRAQEDAGDDMKMRRRFMDIINRK